MVIHGSKLIILQDGSAIAASKSCTVEVDIDLEPVSRPNAATWRHYIAGRKGWKVTTNHLLPSIQPHDGDVAVRAQANNGGSYQASTVTIKNVYGITQEVSITNRGLTFMVLNANGTISTFHYDTYNDLTTCATLISKMTSAAKMLPSVLVSWDAFGATQALADKIADFYQLDIPSTFPIDTGARSSLAIVGFEGKGTMDYRPPVAYGAAGSSAHTRILFQSGVPIEDTPLRDILTRPGATFDLQMETEGYYLDKLIGEAFCKTAKVTGTVASLAQGSFEFIGNGALL